MANYPYYQPQMQQPMYGPNMGYQTPYMGQPMAPQMPAQPVPAGNITPPAPQPQNGFICVPVTAKEEAVATRVEAFGPGVIMPDFGHGMIYFKRFNDKTALADFAEFKLVPEAGQSAGQAQEPQEAQKGPDLMALVGAFQSRFDAIDGKMDAIAEKLDRQPRKRIVVKEADDE